MEIKNPTTEQQLQQLEQSLKHAFKDTSAQEIADRLREDFLKMSKRFEDERLAMTPPRKQLIQRINI